MTAWQLALSNMTNIKSAPPGYKECAAPDCTVHFEDNKSYPWQIYCCPSCSNRTRKAAQKAKAERRAA